MPLQYRTITDEADLLAMLAEAPRRRTVSYLTLPDDFEGPCVCEFPGEALQGNAKVLAIVEAGSSAGRLLDAAWKADTDQDLAAWSACPVRYGPHCSMWVSPDHPEAPIRPGAS